MAKRRKQKDEEEELDFKIPKFDEEKFIKRERRNIKTIFISFIFGIIMALICYGFFALMGPETPLRWPLVFIVMFFNMTFIRVFFEKLNIDLEDFGRKGWFTSIAIYSFTWMLIFVILINPPFYDESPPTIEIYTLPDMQEPGGDILIVAKVIDNSVLNKDNIIVDITHEDGYSLTGPDYDYQDGVLTYRFNNPEGLVGDFEIQIQATDGNGLSNISKTSFKYSNHTIKIPDPTGVDIYPGPNVGYASTIKFDVETKVDRLYYRINDQTKQINVTEKEGDFYVSYPKYEGWQKNQIVNMTVYADVILYFDVYSSRADIVDKENLVPYKNTIIDNQIYHFNTTNDDEIGSEDPPNVSLPEPKIVQIPGFEAVLFILSLLAVALIFKYKNKDKRR